MSPNDAVARAMWWQRGAAADPQQLNRYSYASNNPLRYTDPSGHCVPGPILVVCIGLKALIDAATVAVGAYLIADSARLMAEQQPASLPNGQPTENTDTSEATSDDGMTVYGTGNSTRGPKARPGDVSLDANGNVIPGEGGASSAESIDEIPTRGHVYQKRVLPNDPDIEYVPDGGQPDGRGGVHPPGHVSAVPQRPMPYDDYATSHEQGWEPVRDPKNNHVKRQ
jgi:hypothetical protein